MTPIIEGHLYELKSFEETNPEPIQRIQFIHKEPKEQGSTELVTVANGTTNEEVLKVLINRVQYLNGKFPCRENSIVITKLEEALMWLEKRTRDRIARGVEGKHTK